ncbi:MAG: hypothetical protein WCK75_02755 [Elusimicrobiota bacterium]
MDLISGIVGGLLGGIVGVLGTLVSSYYGPRKMEEWREKRLDEKISGPRRMMLKKMLDDSRFNDGRSIETLSLNTGTKVEDCRLLLIEIGARGLKFRDGREGWALISRKPIDEV